MCDPRCGLDTTTANDRMLHIIHEFRECYEKKLRTLDATGAGDCNLKAKVSLQQNWIRDLNEQNDMLVRAVEDLEQEATERVIALEDKLRQSAQCAFEVMSGYKACDTFQCISALQEDVAQLVSFVKRSHAKRTWNVQELNLMTTSIEDMSCCEQSSSYWEVPQDQFEQKLAKKDEDIRIMQEKLVDAMRCKQQMNSECKKCEEMRQSMLDIRDALTAEVAEKHDTIVTLRRDVQLLEEQCRKAEQQAHFKEDIIKELRRENRKPAAAQPSPQSPKSVLPIPTPNVFECPMRNHRNLETYLNTKTHSVLFVCGTEQEVHNSVSDHVLHVEYRHQRIVHEHDMKKLHELQMAKAAPRGPDMTDDGPRYRAEVPERLFTTKLVHSQPSLRRVEGGGEGKVLSTCSACDLSMKPMQKSVLKRSTIVENARTFLALKDYDRI